MMVVSDTASRADQSYSAIPALRPNDERYSAMDWGRSRQFGPKASSMPRKKPSVYRLRIVPACGR